MTDAVFISAPELTEIAHLRHAFFTRQGGVSGGIFASLNGGIGSNDEREHVLENRARMCRALGVAENRLVTVHQVHSPDVIVVERQHPGERPKADAMVTTTPGIAIGVAHADCGPVLFADRRRRVVGAAHAGWKGAFTGVLENTIAAMEKLGAQREDIVAVLGPTIGPKSYEVGPEFVARFRESDAAFLRFFSPSQKEGHAMFDLPAFIIMRLERTGVTAVNFASDTYANEELFYSYRRSVHCNEPDYGRLISAIAVF
ncbi:peptidoglycan editing factor PgeF [Terrarubrum flagellatum]|uniref:peptidoglycan editing factor PgeF n=1 Tax=Terrirubrum flagellatum TaxID=2895980 RepID=UPI0031452876